MHAPAQRFASGFTSGCVFISRVIIQRLVILRLAVSSHPPGPCPFLANSTRCSGVKSVKRRFGMGGAGVWPGLSTWSGAGWPSPFPRRLSCVCDVTIEPVLSACGSRSGGRLCSRGILKSAPLLDSCNACVRQVDPANHKPPTASSAAMARNRCFLFIFLLILSLRIVCGLSGVGFRFGTKARNSGAKRQRAGMNLILIRLACVKKGSVCIIRETNLPV